MKARKGSLFAAVAAGLLALPMMLAQAPKSSGPPSLRPTIPAADRSDRSKVFLEFAEKLSYDELRDSDVQVLTGNVQFRRGDMFMYCDSARFSEVTGSFDAFDNVRMEQGDTLFVYGDALYYDGEAELAELTAYPGGTVRLINRDVELETEQFFYDLYENVGYYMTGGTLRDSQNRLKSIQGYYYPDSKDAFFYFDVDLMGPRANDTLRMFTDSLTYNTETGVARLIASTLIVNKDGEINSSDGFYYTKTGEADLYRRSVVHTRRGNTLTGDTLFYDRNAGYGEAFGNMVLTDSIRRSAIHGNYGFYNELTDSSFTTGDALVLDYSSADTLYLHGDTIVAYMMPDSSKVTNIFHRVRFFRSDIQGICDSLSVVERDSLMYMYDMPVIWNFDKQIVGNVIYVHFNDSTVDWARLPENGLISEHIAEDCYNQLTGSDMTAWFADSTLSRVYVEGNVQIITFPMENDSTYNKFSFTEGSTLLADFDHGKVSKIVMWPETTGNMTPLYLAKRSSYFLPKFRWYGVLRPMSPDEVFDYPPEMEQLLANPVLGRPRPDYKTVRGTALGRPKITTPPKPAEVTTPEETLVDTPVENPEVNNVEEEVIQDEINLTEDE